MLAAWIEERQIHRRGWRSETGTRPGDCYFLAKRFAIVIGIDPMIFHLEPSDNWLRILDILWPISPMLFGGADISGLCCMPAAMRQAPLTHDNRPPS